MTNTTQEVSEDQVPESFGPASRWRIVVLKHIAAAHAVVGVTEFLRVGGNLAMGVPYSGGPLGIIGIFTVAIAMFLNSLYEVPSADPTSFWLHSQWIARSAGGSHDFFVAMAAAHIGLGVLNLLVGHGLWHRRRWGWGLEIVTIGLAGALVLAHASVLPLAPGQWLRNNWIPLAAALVVALIILAFMLAPGTRELFTNAKAADTPAPSRRRPWWLLSLQWLAGLLVIILAVGLILLFSMGPMVEVVLLNAHLTPIGLH
ncbi:MAG: hypothetical protein ACP5XB_15075 [Isosphaeraceae bacterium]